MGFKYEADEKTMEDLNRRFTYHTPEADQLPRYEQIRQKAHDFAIYLVLNTPKSREQSTALTKLDEVVMMANAAIARNEGDGSNVEHVIMVNGSSTTVNKSILTYEDVVELAGYKRDRILSVIVKFPDGAQSMTPGAEVVVRKNMIFSVADTSNA